MTKTINKQFDPINFYKRFIVRGSMVLMILLSFIIQLPAQTIISSTGDGGFETGATFALNGWTAVNDANSKWYVGTFAKSLGARGVYIDVNGTAGTANNYNSSILTNRISHFYRDVTIPAGATNIVLSFKWKANGENGTGADDYDFLRVSLAPTSVTPAATALPSAAYTIGTGKYNLQSAAFQTATINLSNSIAGTSQRLIFTWKNDVSVTNNPGAAVDEISLTYTPGSGCTGIPTPGNTLASANPVCSGTAFSLTLQNATAGSGVTYQWQSSPNNSTWTNISGANSALLSTSITAATYFRCEVSCAGSPGLSNSLLVNLSPSYTCVCAPSYTNSCSVDYISNVTFAGINNSTGCTGSTPSNLTTYTSPNPSITGGLSYPISVTTDGDEEGINVWIDYNMNGVFEGSESVLSGLATTIPATFSGTVNVPLGITSGQTIMRVRCRFNNTVGSACNNFDYGETEDYYITLVAPPPCITPPVAGTASGPSSACTGVASAYSVAGGSGDIQWQLSTTSVSGPFADIAGETSATFNYNASSSGVVYLRTKHAVLGCVDAYSNVLTVTVNPAASVVASATPTSVCPGNVVNLSASGGVSFSNTTDYPIPDFILTNGIVNSPIVISGFSPAVLGTATVKSVSFNINHTFVGDLRLRLFAPGGGAVTMVDQAGGSGVNFVNTTIVSSGGANGNIAAGTAPFTGTYNSQVAFSGLTGNTNGTWNLRAIDLAGGDVGTILDWTLVLESDGVLYTWSSNPAGFNSSLQNPTDNPVSTTQYSVSASYNGCVNTSNVTVNVNALPEITTSSNAPVCENQDINLVSDNIAAGQSTGNIFTWTGPGGFLSGSQSPTISAATAANVGWYYITVQNSFGCSSIDSLEITINENPDLNILSQTNVLCNGALTGAYTIEVTNPILGGNYLYNDGSNTQFNDGTFTGIGAGSYSVEVTDDNSCSSTIPVTITEPDPTTTADAGTDQITCFGNTATLAGNIALVGTGSWTVTAGTATVTNPSDPNSTVTGLSAGLNTFRWTIDNALCSNSNFDEVDINVNALPTASMSGTTEICNGNSTTLTVVFTGAAPYTYSYSDGVTTFGPFTTSNATENITVAPNTTRTYTVTSVDDSNCPGTTSGSAVVTVTQAPPSNSVTVLSIPATGCVGDLSVVTTNAVIGATGYTWTVFPNTLINGQSGGTLTTTSPSATFTLGTLPPNESGWDICVTASNACGQTNTKCRSIRGALSTPAVISGTTVACANSSGTYSTQTVAGAAGYNWTGTSGITFTGTGTSVTANFPSGFTSGQICVAATLSCGYSSAQRCITVTNSVSQLGIMSGPFAVCPGQSGLVFSVPSNSGLASYAWTAPAGVTITSGQGTNSVTVSVAPGFNIGNLCVTGTSNCGVTSAARCKTVSSTLPVTPGNISGISNGVCNSTVTYSVPAVSGVTAYNWTAPSGATIVSGQGTNTVEVSYPNGFNNGQLCVTAQNGCGTSSARCINIKGVPASPGVISGPITVCTGEQGLNYSIATMFGASNYTWVVPTGTTIIAGQGTPSIFVDWGTTGGLVTVTATNSCGVSGTRTLNVIVNCKMSGNEIPGVLVNAYPNPVASELTVEVTAETSNTYALEMTDLSGRVVYSGQMNTTGGMKTTTVDVSNLSKGMYMLTVRSNDGFSNQIRIAVQ